MLREQLDLGLMVAGGVVLIAGSFLGWAILLGQSVSGVEGRDGWICVTGAVVLIAYAVRRLLGIEGLPTWLAWAGLLTAVTTAGLNLIDILDTGGDDVAVGFGMKLMILGGFLGLCGLTDRWWMRRFTPQT